MFFMFHAVFYNGSFMRADMESAPTKKESGHIHDLTEPGKETVFFHFEGVLPQLCRGGFHIRPKYRALKVTSYNNIYCEIMKLLHSHPDEL